MPTSTSQWFASSSAEWITVICLLIGLILQWLRQRKKLKITPQWVNRDGKQMYQLLVSNVGAVPVGIKSYGYTGLDGTVKKIDQPGPTILNEKFHPEDEDIELYFYDSTLGEPLPIKETDIYYVFVKTRGGKTFKKFLK